MSTVAKLKHLGIAPRKVRLVIDLIRGKKASEAKAILTFTVKRAAEPVLKLLNSAVSNAKQTKGLSEANLYISKITVDEGRKQKRWRPRARGQAYQIQKKSSHVTIILNEIKGEEKGVKETGKKGEKRMAKKKREKESKTKKPEFKTEFRPQKPKTERGIKRIFRRKAF